MKTKIFIILAALFAATGAIAQGAFSNIQPVFGVAIGTYGPQISAGIDVNKYLTTKLQGGYFKFDVKTNIEDAKGTVSPTYGDAGTMIEVHPFVDTNYAHGFHTDFGLFYSNFNVVATPDDPSQLSPLKNISGVTIPPGTLKRGDLVATARFNAFQPYIGVGYMWRKASGIGVSFDVGAFYQGTPTYNFDTSQLQSKLQGIVPAAELNKAIAQVEGCT